MEIVVTDMEGNYLKEVDFSFDDEVFEYVPQAEEVPEISEIEFFENLDHKVNIFIPSKNGDDFLIQYFSKESLKSFNVDEDDVRGRYFSEAFPLFRKTGVIKFFNKVNESGETVELRELQKIEGILIYAFKHKIFKLDGKIYHIIRDETDLRILNLIEDNVFQESIQPSFLVQSNKIIKVNNAFLDFFEINENQVLGVDFDLSKFEDSNLSKNELNQAFNDVLNRKLFFFFYEFSMNVPKIGKRWFRQYYSPITYNCLPAVKVFFDDITEFKESKNKIQSLYNDLDVVQKMNKLAMGYNNEGKIFWNDELFNILEIEPEEFERGENFILEKYISASDKEAVISTIKSWSPENNPLKFISKIVTKKGNLKYILANLKAIFNEKGEPIYSTGYIRDVSSRIKYENQLKSNLIKLEDTLNELKDISNELEEVVNTKNFLVNKVCERVNNNLQIIISLLNLEKRFNSDNPECILLNTKKRINTLILIHEKIYSSSNLININFKDYIEGFMSYLLDQVSFDNVFLNLDLDDVLVSMDSIVPLGLIINEFMDNIFKYSLSKENECNIAISLRIDENEEGFASLFIRNDSLISKDLNIWDDSTLSFAIINTFIQQLGGELIQLEENGSVFEVKFAIVSIN